MHFVAHWRAWEQRVALLLFGSQPPLGVGLQITQFLCTRSGLFPWLWAGPEMQGFGGSTYRPSYRHPGVATCSLGKPGPILGSAATGTARSAVGGPFQTFLAEHRARATGVSL